MVFTCYLFDRKIIDAEYVRDAGITGAETLQSIAALPAGQAVPSLYKLFKRLGEDFNGDLFSDDLDAEASGVTADHTLILARFLSGAEIRSGQRRFWPYDFSAIPVETISAIYEHFLKVGDEEEKRKKGAFYTPRFLAEVVIDMALEGTRDLLEKRFFDPACGSGIFLVGLFNRLAEEWARKNPEAGYEERARGLMAVFRDNLAGADDNPTACRIAAFSLYLAFLDQLRPSHIRELQKRKKVLPRLVYAHGEEELTICCGDFFLREADKEQRKFDLVVGNPPWAPASGPATTAERWCAEQKLPLANRQLAFGFVWKAPRHLAVGGKVCFVLPSGLLFNHQEKAITFQREWVSRHALEVVLNLADYQRFLFKDAEFPAVVVRYLGEKAPAGKASIRYWVPKLDWSVSKAEVISVVPEDRKEIAYRELRRALGDESAPHVWKVRFWATPRDEKLLERLSDLPRLAEITKQPREKAEKRWSTAQGFKPEKGDIRNDNSKQNPWTAEQLFIEASSKSIELFVLESDCTALKGRFPWLHRLPEMTEIFDAPHVLVSQGLHVAYCDFDVVFRHALQGIHGPGKDRDLLSFLAAYLRSPLARYFLFHTSSNWGVGIAKVHLEELLLVPFLLPDGHETPRRAREIVAQVAKGVCEATQRAGQVLADRPGIVQAAQEVANGLIYEYFDLDENERALVEETNIIVIPSTRRSRASDSVPTLRPSTPSTRSDYLTTLCSTLNGWAGKGAAITGRMHISAWSGVGAVELLRGATQLQTASPSAGFLAALERISEAYKTQLGSVELLRGVKVFEKDRLLLFKPLHQRFWTRTAALNDADQIAEAVLTKLGKGVPNMNVGDPALWSDVFPEYLIPEILDLVWDTWRILPLPKPDEYEVPLTRRFKVELRQTEELPTAATSDRAGIAGRRPDDQRAELGRIDLKFTPAGSANEDVYFAFECKRLYPIEKGKRKARTAEYVAEGMLRFASGQYASIMRHGGMIGYVLNGRCDTAIAAVEANFAANQTELFMKTPAQFGPSNLRKDNPHIRETTHDLPGVRGFFSTTCFWPAQWTRRP